MGPQECLDCQGTLLFTGIGKSGFIAQKVCQTLVSTGTKAVYLSPTGASQALPHTTCYSFMRLAVCFILQNESAVVFPPAMKGMQMSVQQRYMRCGCADALHGDIGIVGREDLVVMVSKSGATEELLKLVPYVKARRQLYHVASLASTR